MTCRTLTLALWLLASAAAPAGASVRPAGAEVPAPDLRLDGFPVWLGADGRLDRLVVLVEGFDIYNSLRAEDLLRLAAPVTDGLRAQGTDLLVVDFPDSHRAPDELAPYLARAIRAAAGAVHAPVAVAGFSAGGIVARWALVAAEEQGEPLPVHTLVLVDTPNRGARLSPALQAIAMRYGGEQNRSALGSPAARALLTCGVADIRWKKLGVPGARRCVPASWTLDATAHQAFYDRLRRLNDNRGYPRHCRLIAIAFGSREAPAAPEELLHLWLPFGREWTCGAEPEDRVPGSCLPDAIAERFRLRKPLGIAGSYLRGTPTFISTESALDAAPGERPPFDEWYVRADHLPPLPHDRPDAGVVSFTLRALIGRLTEVAGAGS